MSAAPGWYPDPAQLHELRYYDGTAWTEHVSDRGVGAVDPLPPGGPGSGRGGRAIESVDQALSWDDSSAAKVQQQAAAAGGGLASSGSMDLFSEPVLVVNQRAKLIEVSNEYAIFDADGRKIGAVVQVGQSTARKALRLLSNLDQYLKVHLDVLDASGTPVLRLTRPGKVIKSTVIVQRPDGTEVGRLVQENMVGKIRFGMVVGEHRYGSINAENWRAWNFSIRDHAEQEVARITKTWEGFAKAAFTTADNYVVQVHRPLEDPLRTLVVAAAVSVDTALKQNDSGGLGI